QNFIAPERVLRASAFARLERRHEAHRLRRRKRRTSREPIAYSVAPRVGSVDLGSVNKLLPFIAITLATSPALADDPAKPLDQSPQGRSAEPEDTNPKGSFEFGSYGRVGIASDLQGRVATPINFVSHGPRFDEDSYAELELRRE